MTITLGSNISSIRAIRSAQSTSSRLEEVFTRLSSGQRINSAADDAAGLAIADSLRVNSRIYGQAIRNVNDGLSMIAIAEGAIQQLSGLMTRIAELAEQSANGVYGTAQRTAMTREVDALKDEYNRIVGSTTFNGKQLLADSSATHLQLGIDSSANSRLSVTTSIVSSTVGDGTFQAEVNITAGGSNSAIASGDFNRDGNADIVTLGSGTGGFSISLGNGDGTFRTPVAYSTGVSTAYYQEIAIGDVNGDGVQDLITTGTYSDNIGVVLGNSNGTFQAARVLTAVSTSVNNDIQLGDFNGDGKLDIATADYSNSLLILLGNGDGYFSAATSFAAAGIKQLAHGDINGDGKLDIVSSSGQVFIGNGNGTFSTGTGFSGVGRSMSLADVNGDGKLDAIGVGSGGTSLYLALGQGNGTFGTVVSFVTGGTSNNDYQLSMADLNGDGLADAVVSENTTDSIGVFLGSSSGTFAPRVSYGAPTGAGFVGDATALADFNNDGAVDIAVGESNEIGLLLGNAVNSSSISGLDVSSASAARSTLDQSLAVLSRLATSLGALGAAQSRLAVSAANLASGRENTLQAESRIRDVDVADQSGELTRLTLLQQAGAQVLEQANRLPALALQLLKN